MLPRSSQLMANEVLEFSPSRTMSALHNPARWSDTFLEIKGSIRGKIRPFLFKTLNGIRFLPSEKMARRLKNGFLAEAYRRSSHIQTDALLFRERLFPKLDLKVDPSFTSLGARKSREKVQTNRLRRVVQSKLFVIAIAFSQLLTIFLK